MEQEIYVDILVFLNTVINFFLIMMTAALAGREKRIGRILAAAFLGGIYALILLLPQLSGPVLTLTRVAAAAVMTWVAFPALSLRMFLFQWGLLYLVGFLFAGVMIAVWFFFSPPAMLYGNGVVYFHIPAMWLVFGVMAVYGAVWLCARRRTHQSGRGPEQVQIGIDGKRVSLWGEVDTGNRLFDPFSGLPVVICRYQSVKELLCKQLTEYFEHPGVDQIEKVARLGIRFIPYEAVGKEGLLPVVRPDFLAIRQNGRYQQVEQVMAAIADQDFLDSGYGILLHPGLHRLDCPKKTFQEKGDRYGKDNQGKDSPFFRPHFGRKRGDLLHKRPGKSAVASDPGGGGTGIPATAGGCRGKGNTDRP